VAWPKATHQNGLNWSTVLTAWWARSSPRPTGCWCPKRSGR
jgi:hypothetical protein